MTSYLLRYDYVELTICGIFSMSKMRCIYFLVQALPSSIRARCFYQNEYGIHGFLPIKKYLTQFIICLPISAMNGPNWKRLLL